MVTMPTLDSPLTQLHRALEHQVQQSPRWTSFPTPRRAAVRSHPPTETEGGDESMPDLCQSSSPRVEGGRFSPSKVREKTVSAGGRARKRAASRSHQNPWRLPIMPLVTKMVIGTPIDCGDRQGVFQVVRVAIIECHHDSLTASANTQVIQGRRFPSPRGLLQMSNKIVGRYAEMKRVVDTFRHAVVAEDQSVVVALHHDMPWEH